METICNEKGMEFLVPIIDVCTRWNSMYDMLVRALKYKDVLSDVFFRHKDIDLIKLVLNAEDWK
jgi:hypothetical protein